VVYYSYNKTSSDALLYPLLEFRGELRVSIGDYNYRETLRTSYKSIYKDRALFRYYLSSLTSIEKYGFASFIGGYKHGVELFFNSK
jgi:hypothetical protein